MNKILLLIVVPCLLGYIFVQAQYGYPSAGGGGGEYYNQFLASRYLQTQRKGFLGLTAGQLFAAALTFWALYLLTNGTGKIIG